MEQPELATTLKNTLLEFLVDMNSIFCEEEEQSDLMLVSLYFRIFDKTQIMQIFIDKLLPYKKQIVDRDLKFFISNKCTFASLPVEKVQYYSKMLVDKNRLSREDEKVLWEYFDMFIYLTEEYKKSV